MDRPRYKVADPQRGVFVGDTPTQPVRAHAGGKAAPSPAFAGWVVGLCTWLAGRWWHWSGTAWSPTQRSDSPSVTWGDPMPMTPELDAWARAELARSGFETICGPFAAGAWFLVAAEQGAPAIRRAVGTPAAVSQLAAPPPPESRAPFVDWKDSLHKAAAQVARDFRRRRVIEDAARATEAVHRAGKRGRPDPDAIVWALFEDQKARAPFHRDPVDTELIASTEAILCLDPDGACNRGGDCDDQMVALASRAMAMGVPVRLRARKFAKLVQPHADLEYDAKLRGEAKWKGIDPSVEDGKPRQPNDLSGPVVDTYYLDIDTSPQFIGLGEPPPEDAPETLGADPTTTAPGSSSSSSSTTTAQLTAMDDASAAAWTQLVTAASNALSASLTELETVRTQYSDVRTALGLQSTDGGATTPEGSTTTTASTTPLSDYIASVASGSPNWTPAAEAAEEQLVSAAQFMSGALADAVSGARRIIWDQSGTLQGKPDVLIEASAADQFRVLLVKQSDGTFAATYFDPSSNQSTGTLGAVWEWLAVGAVVAAVSVAASIAVSHYMDTLRAAHNDDMLERVSQNQAQLVATGKQTPAQALAQTQAITGAAAALNAPTAPQTADSFASVARWVGIAGISLASVVGMLFALRTVEAFKK